MKRLLLLLLMIAIAFLASCSDDRSDKNDTEINYQAITYIAEKIELPDIENQVVYTGELKGKTAVVDRFNENISVSLDQKAVRVFSADSSKFGINRYDLITAEMTDVVLEQSEKYEGIKKIIPSYSDISCAIMYKYETQMSDYYDEITKSNIEVRNEAEVCSLCKWDNDGHLLFSVRLDNIVPGYTDMNLITSIVSKEGNVFLNYDNKIYVISPMGELRGTIDVGDHTYYYKEPYGYSSYNDYPRFDSLSDGTIGMYQYSSLGASGYPAKPTFKLIDEDKMLFINNEKISDRYIDEIYLGPEFRYYRKTMNDFVGINDDGDEIQLFTWLDVGIVRDEVRYLKVISPDLIIIAINSRDTRRITFHRITKGSADDGRTAIRMAYDSTGSGVSSQEIARYISKFNSTNPDYRIDLVAYTSDEIGRSANEKLISDILSGEAPEMVLFGSSITPELFVRQNLLVNLYDLMGDDYKKKDFLPTVLTPFESDKGELPYLVTQFTLNTLTGKAANLKSIKNLTVDDLIKLEKSLGKDQQLMSLQLKKGQTAPMKLLELFLPNMLDSFIDYEKQTVTLGDEFKKLLEFCKNARVTALDGEISPNELRGDNVILDDKMYAMSWYLTAEHLDFGEPVASIGYPSSEGPVVRAITRFGITKQCEVPEGAWEFITLVLDEQYAKFEELAALDSTSFADLNYLPCTYAAYEKYTECFTNCRQYVRFQIRMDQSNTYEIGAYNLVGVRYLTDEEKKLLDAKSQRVLTEAEVARLSELKTEQRAKKIEQFELDYPVKYDVTKAEVKAFTKMLESVKQAYIVDEDATAIILEDANDYFIGRKSIDEVVKLIQNRLTTMVNE